MLLLHSCVHFWKSLTIHSSLIQSWNPMDHLLCWPWSRSRILSEDRNWQASQRAEHPSLRHLEELLDVQWYEIWDLALGRGCKATAPNGRAIKVFGLLSTPLYTERPCMSNLQPHDWIFFKHIIEEYLSMNSFITINSLQELSNPEHFEPSLKFDLLLGTRRFQTPVFTPVIFLLYILIYSTYVT